MSTPDDLAFQPASDQSLLIYLGRQVSLDSHHRVTRLLHLLQSEPIAGVRNLHPAYCSILVDFDALELTHQQLVAILGDYAGRAATRPLPEPRRIEIPACYGGEFGPDLDDVANIHGISPAQVIELHSAVTFSVYFLGFVPGFAYLGDLPEALATPRLPVPRRSTPPGSVGIAGAQTAIYPFATPGGWRLIARTPVAMFRAGRDTMSLLSVGDHVRFTPITTEQFAPLQNA